MKLNKHIFAFLIFTSSFFIGLFTLKDYGINWDAVNHFPRGQAYLNFFLYNSIDYSNINSEGYIYSDPKSLFFDNSEKYHSFYQFENQNFYDFVYNIEQGGHPPVSDILSSLFNKIFFSELKIISDIDSYNIYGIFLVSCLLVLIFYWIHNIFNFSTALLAVFFIYTYPLFFAEMHFNTQKDIPEAVFYSFFLYSIWKVFETKNAKWLVFTSLFWFLGLGTKLNILFSCFVVIPYIILTVNKKIFYKKYLRIYFLGFIAFMFGNLLFFLSWPYLWSDPLGHLLNVFLYYKNIGITDSSIYDSRFLVFNNVNLYPIFWIITTTFIPVLFFLFFSFLLPFVNSISKKQKRFLLLIWLWFLVPILRVTYSHSTIYGGVRQLMEYIPAMGILSASGYYFLSKKVNKFFLKLLSFIFCVFIIFNLIKNHPYQNAYFNEIVGGLKGAQKMNIPFWGNTFGGAYRKGIVWINENAEPNAKLTFGYELNSNIPTIWLRPDISLSPENISYENMKGEYVISLTYYDSVDSSSYLKYLNSNIKPLYQAKVDGVSVLTIWKNAVEYKY